MDELIIEEPANKTLSPDKSNLILKTCIFATGLSGIVAEYVMSTLASYLLGNTVLQWTLTVSLMLFAMGVGSRLSKYLRTNLLDTFILIEFSLSVFCAMSATLTYFLAIYVQIISPIIYTIAFAIGLLIGLEIPLATRLNDYFEELRVNISSVMEKDYYGALFGGLLFAFVALPYLGLTYTPIILGTVNFLVALVLYLKFRHLLKFKNLLLSAVLVVPLFLLVLFYLAEPIVLYGEQYKYRDHIIYREQSAHQRIVITEWKDNYWLYLNGNQQFSTYDEERYHEPLVHPAMHLAAARSGVLILGGGDGLAAREILKYKDTEKITLVDIDPAVTNLGRSFPMLIDLNNGSLLDRRVEIRNEDAYAFLRESGHLYDVIIVDLPDPKSVDIARLYSLEFYRMALKSLSRGGVLVTQATSPFFARTAYLSILKTIRAAGMPAIALHNHVPTLGDWGWVVAMNAPGKAEDWMREKLAAETFDGIETRFLNNPAMRAMMNFGKGIFEDYDDIRINDQRDMAVFFYYRQGIWEIY